MGLATQHLSSHEAPVSFEPDDLAAALRHSCPEVTFALLMGSARDGIVPIGGDIDLALFLFGEASLDLHGRVLETVRAFAPTVHCDVGFLNRAEPVYRFEALKGRLLFARDREAYLNFFSLTCREYESQLADYELQYQYRTGVS